MSNREKINYQKVLYQTINYILHTRNKGLLLNLKDIIRNLRSNTFRIRGRANSNFVTNTKTRKSISSLHIILNKVPVIIQSIG